MRFDPEASQGGFDPPRDTQALYHKRVAGRSELDQLGIKSRPEAPSSTLMVTLEARARLTTRSERVPPCHNCNGGRGARLSPPSGKRFAAFVSLATVLLDTFNRGARSAAELMDALKTRGMGANCLKRWRGSGACRDRAALMAAFFVEFTARLTRWNSSWPSGSLLLGIGVRLILMERPPLPATHS